MSISAQERGDTVYLTTADRWGNMASFIYSIYDYFGANITIPGYGFPMNDRGSFFDLDPNSASVIAPHKRPFLTIIPAFVMKDGQPLLSWGNMGGDEQAQAQATEMVNFIDLGMNIQAAGDAARFHHSQSRDRVDLESKLYALVGASWRRWATTSDASMGTTTCSVATRRSCSRSRRGSPRPRERTSKAIRR